MPIDPTDLAKSIGALGSLDPQRGLARTLQQVTDGAKQLFRADGAGLMLIDAEGALRWASASDQTAQTLEDRQERLAQGPCSGDHHLATGAGRGPLPGVGHEDAACFVWARDCLPWLLCCAGLC
jgi:hypothetical protein